MHRRRASFTVRCWPPADIAATLGNCAPRLESEAKSSPGPSPLPSAGVGVLGRSRARRCWAGGLVVGDF